ncbi:NADH-quinone oxidoreductase subunit N [Dactylosporangium roseum]|uniref:NADH-quinone oxidoreductase subunit N n=1 Tax=Dactylosporangium roseum TaxID=47989 RepID=A0ABY5Z5I8_9ACTN|nr:proton-conducting transporter membrane subunit [Dactylosporangium roseum]UWZ36087.1 NADH-quinone oxidoreductase subunit N [Dactylosporangium roseum]
MTIDQVALLPTYLAAGTAVLALIVDLVAPGRRGAVAGATALGMAGTIAAAVVVGLGFSGDASPGHRDAFCVGPDQCSLVFDPAAAIVTGLFAALALGALALSAPLLRTGEVPAGEYCFLLACSLTGAVVLGGARDLITLIVALETLTLPLYLLVGLRRGSRTGSSAAVTFFVVSVVSTAVALLGAALVFTATGGVHFGDIARGQVTPAAEPLLKVGVVLLLAGLGFKVAAVPAHAWAPATYDGAPLPVAAYLSTASKLGGVVALLLVGVSAARPVLATAGLTLAVLAVLSMTVGNLVALRQRRMVRLLAWSSVAQAGYLLAPLGALLAAGGRSSEAVAVLVAATIGYTFFYVVLEFSAFGALVAVRGADDGGEFADYRGLARRSPWITAVLVIALTGLAGLPPGLAGLFAKVAVVRALLGGDAVWLAIVVALNAVVGLAYYVRAAATLFAASPEMVKRRVAWPVAAAVGLAAAVAVLLGFAPEAVLRAAETFS